MFNVKKWNISAGWFIFNLRIIYLFTTFLISKKCLFIFYSIVIY